jgi:transposase
LSLDESGFVQDMPRLRGYAPIGQRCYGVHDWKAYGRTNAIGALIGTRLITVGLFQSNVNALVFKSWLAQDLLPKVPPRCIIIMDNAAFHKTSAVKHLIENAWHTLDYLPPYSPDLNPIEKIGTLAKSIRRTFQYNIDELFQHPLI